MSIRGTTFTTALAVASASLVVAGCGGDDTSSSTGASTATTSESREDGVRKVVRGLITGLSAGSKGTAEQRKAVCASLSTEASAKLVTAGQQFGATDCPQTLEKVGALVEGTDQYAKAQTTPIDVTIAGESATAAYAAPLDGERTVVTLGRLGDTWVIQALPTTGDSAGAATTATTTPSAEVAPAAPSAAPTEADAPSGDMDPNEILAGYMPGDVLKSCKPITGENLPDGIVAALHCKPSSGTEINYGMVRDRETLDGLYGNAKDGGPPRGATNAVAGTDCQQAGRHEGRFTNQTFGIQDGRVRCWTLSTGHPRFQWYVDGSADDAPIFLMEGTETDKDWASFYRTWAQDAGPNLDRN